MTLLAVPSLAAEPTQMAAAYAASAMFDAGDTAGARTAIEAMLKATPDNPHALYQAARFDFMLGNLDVARGRCERLVKLMGNFASAWDLLTQIAQAQGDLARRNEAVDRAKSAIHTAIDPDIRRKGFIVRDRLPVRGNSIWAIDYFESAGNEFTRYQFHFGDFDKSVGTDLLLRTDIVTSQRWADTALLAPDKPLFHLDMVDPAPGGGEKSAVYAYYVGEPDYDTVRTQAIAALRGEAQPLSGQPGSLAGLMK